MNRRGFLTGTGLAILAAPLASEAQQAGQLRRIGFMAPPAGPIHVEQAFRQGLREHGWIEGQNLAIEWRFAAGKNERFTDFATEFVRLNVDLIVTGGPHAALAAQQATKAIPIVMVGVGHAVELGLVASLARPGGNITGMTLMAHDLSGKALQLLHEAVPEASRIAVLRMSGKMNDHGVAVTEAAARSLGVHLSVHQVQGPADFDRAFATMVKERAQALVALSNAMFLVERRQIAALAAKHRLPAIGHTKEFVEAGGLLGYGDDVAESARRAAFYVDRILKGARPADLPIERPTKFELAVNLRTARALGLTIPPSVLLRADEVIQ